MTEEELKIIVDYLCEVQLTMEDDWHCDHNVGVCWCDFHDKRSKCTKIIRKYQRRFENDRGRI